MTTFAAAERHSMPFFAVPLHILPFTHPRLLPATFLFYQTIVISVRCSTSDASVVRRWSIPTFASADGSVRGVAVLRLNAFCY